LRDIGGSRLLDYGCGWGETSIEYYEKGAYVTGIDISEKFINAANNEFDSRGYDKNRYQFIKMDAHNLQFDDGAFDYVVGDGILHHLDTEKALSEIYRVLKPGGKVILFEPLAGNPLLKIFRLLTPRARTVDEKPITGNDLHAFENSHPWCPSHRYCGILEAPIAVITSVLMPSRPDNWLLKSTDKLEKWLINNKVLLSWNQYVLLIFEK
jgi:SAM-dependent methyltransferase